MQKLILPLNDCQALCGYKNAVYQNAWGRPHYGMDLWTDADKTVWAMGKGEVIAAGFDNVYGGTVVVLYKGVRLHTGEEIDLVARCYHMEKVYVKKGQEVSTATKLGVMGNTGQYTSGEHLHVEFDTDTKWPCYTIELKNNSNIMKRGTGADTTIDPAYVLYVKESEPDNQRIMANDSYLNRGFVVGKDYALPVFDEEKDSGEVKYNKLLDDYRTCYEQLAAEKQKRAALLKEISALVERYTK